MKYIHINIYILYIYLYEYIYIIYIYMNNKNKIIGGNKNHLALQNFNVGYDQGYQQGIKLSSLVHLSANKKIISNNNKSNNNNIPTNNNDDLNNLKKCLYSDVKDHSYDKEEIKFPNSDTKKDYERLINVVIKSIIDDNWGNDKLTKKFNYGNHTYYQNKNDKRYYIKKKYDEEPSAYNIHTVKSLFNGLGNDIHYLTKKDNNYLHTEIVDNKGVKNELNIYTVPMTNNTDSIDKDFSRSLNDISTDFNVLNFTSNKMLRLKYIIITINTIQKTLDIIYKQNVNLNKNNLNIMFKGGVTMRALVFNMIDTFNISGEIDFYNRYKKNFKISDFDFEIMVSPQNIDNKIIIKINILLYFVLIELNKYFYKYKNHYYNYYKLKNKEKQILGNKFLNQVHNNFFNHDEYKKYSVLGICIEQNDKIQDCVICDEVDIDINFDEHKDKQIHKVEMTINASQIKIFFNDGTDIVISLNYKTLINSSEYIKHELINIKNKKTGDINNILRITIKNNIIKNVSNNKDNLNKFINLNKKKFNNNGSILETNNFTIFNSNKPTKGRGTDLKQTDPTGIVSEDDFKTLYNIKYTPFNNNETIGFYTTHNNVNTIINENTFLNFTLNRTKKTNTIFLINNDTEKLYSYNIKGELIDLGCGGLKDIQKSKKYINNYNFNKYFNNFKILDYTLNKQEINYYSYTLKGHISDLSNIIFYEYDLKPWEDRKYNKRINRLIICIYLNLFTLNIKNKDFTSMDRIKLSTSFINYLENNTSVPIFPTKTDGTLLHDFLQPIKDLINALNQMNERKISTEDEKKRDAVINSLVKFSKEMHNLFCKKIYDNKLIKYDNKIESSIYNIRNNSIY